MYSYCFLESNTGGLEYKKRENIRLWGTANFPDILENNIEETISNLPGGVVGVLL